MKSFLLIALTAGFFTGCMNKKAQSHAITDARDICANAAAGKIPYTEAARKLGLPGFLPPPDHGVPRYCDYYKN
tara:strand:- start:291 stop:512 length:222 start_codon:yes stop_codon:yes gene_type:complete